LAIVAALLTRGLKAKATASTKVFWASPKACWPRHFPFRQPIAFQQPAKAFGTLPRRVERGGGIKAKAAQHNQTTASPIKRQRASSSVRYTEGQINPAVLAAVVIVLAAIVAAVVAAVVAALVAALVAR